MNKPFRPDWHSYFLAIAKVISTRSTCSSRPVGCVIVRDNRILVTGYNGPPAGAPHCAEQGDGRFCLRRAANVPEKDKQAHCPSIHAEDNAIRFARNLGIDLTGASLYCTLSPCGACIEKLRIAGVTRVFYELSYQSADPVRDGQWAELARNAFAECQQVDIPGWALDKIMAALAGKTSHRRL